MTNILIYTAVPFSLGRMQSVGRVALRSCVDVSNMQTGLRSDGQTCSKKKRTRLTHLTQEEKHLRRKMMCREASQKARDSVNIRMNILEKKVQELKRERDILLTENRALKENHRQLTNDNKKLLQTTYLGRSNQSEDTSPRKSLSAEEYAVTVPESLDFHGDRRSLEHAWFINTPLLKGQDLQQFFVIMTMMAITELLSVSFPQVTTEVLIRDLVVTSHQFISNMTSRIVHTLMNSVYLPFSYHKSWT